MCKYCDVTFSGYANNVLVDEAVSMNRVKIFGVQTYICGRQNDELFLETSLDTMSCRNIVMSKVKIQYCPMCGRKLIKEPN